MKQRTIKFRAWDKVNKRMLQVDKMYWNLAQDKICIICLLDEKHEIALAVDEFILLQYTGLKDKNGVEIYEGDVVACGYWQDDYKKVEKNVVVFEDGHFQNANTFDALTEIEIIGNIYENKELIK